MTGNIDQPGARLAVVRQPGGSNRLGAVNAMPMADDVGGPNADHEERNIGEAIECHGASVAPRALSVNGNLLAAASHPGAILARTLRPENLLWQGQMPHPISLNNIFAGTKSNGNGRRFKTPKYESWKKTACGMILAAGRRPNISEPFAIVIQMSVHGVSERIDTDNCCKAYLDALVSMRVIEDDSRRLSKAVIPLWHEGTGGAWVSVYRWAE